jgi:hypothetical protein
MMNPADRGMAVVHVCRFEGDKIAEAGDIAHAIAIAGSGEAEIDPMC